MINLVTFSTLFPNAEAPHHGIFVETRLRNLVSTGAVSARVIAPVPWFPFESRTFGRYGSFARVPRHEVRFGLDVVHPRFLNIPKVGMSIAPALLARGAMPAFKRLMTAETSFDAIDAHYFYPDGVAAAIIAQATGRPFVVTARGTDVTLIPDYPAARRQIIWAARRAAAIVTVCESLKRSLLELGVDGSRVRVLRNGVDLQQFHPIAQDEARADLELPAGPWIASVGHLIPRKGHDIVIRALLSLPGVRLLIVGAGPQEGNLRSLIRSLALEDRVVLFGTASQDRLRTIYSAVDALVLASSREGWANVLLESMACGTPVIATDVDGTAEVVQNSAGGLLVGTRTPEALAASIDRLLKNPPRRSATRKYSEAFGWAETTRGQVEMFRSILERPTAPRYRDSKQQATA